MLHGSGATQSETRTPARPADVQLRGRRSPKLVALGVVLVALGALGAAALYSWAVDRESVIVMARDVARGSELTRDDVTVMELAADSPAETIPASKIDSLVGQTALTDLPSGAFPAPRHLGKQTIPAGSSLVGLLLTPGQLPVTTIPVGATVSLVPIDGAEPSPTRAVVAAAPRLSDDGFGYVVDVIVDNADAPRIAALAATGQLAMTGEG
ncbi:MAG: SAF domain-containing protein [Arachnia sp.]